MPTSGGLQQRNDHVHFSPSTSVTPVKTSDSGAFAQLNHSKSAFFGGIEEPTTPKTTKRHLRYGLSAMLMLTLQGTILAIVLRYSRIKSGRRYLPSVAGKKTEQSINNTPPSSYFFLKGGSGGKKSFLKKN